MQAARDATRRPRGAGNTLRRCGHRKGVQYGQGGGPRQHETVALAQPEENLDWNAILFFYRVCSAPLVHWEQEQLSYFFSGAS